MNQVEQQVRDELHTVSFPADLHESAGLGGLADTVLRREGRSRRTALAVGAVASAVVLAIGIPAAMRGGGPGTDPAGVGAGGATTTTGPVAGASVGPGGVLASVSPGESGAPGVAAQGGGPMAVHVITMVDGSGGTTNYLLDPATGRYRALPYEHAVLSPDLRWVAVTGTKDGEWLGVAARDALLRGDRKAIRWLNTPPCNGPVWAPDGSALVCTSLTKSDRSVTFTAQRYNQASGKVTQTPVKVNLLGASVGWSADSRRLLALQRGAETADSVVPDGSRFLDLDGTPLTKVDVTGFVGGADSYSPSRKLMTVDPTALMTEHPNAATVADAATGQLVQTLPGVRPVGWYDENTVAVLRSVGDVPQLELLRFADGVVSTVRIVTFSGQVTGAATAAPGGGPPKTFKVRSVQLGPAQSLSGPAAAVGF